MKNNILKNTIMLYGLSIAKIVFPLITLPYLTRVLSVECYGVVAYVKAIMSYMQTIVDFGFMLSGTKDVVAAAKNKTRLGRISGEVMAARILLAAACLIILIVLSFTLPILKGYKLYTLLAYSAVFLSIFLFDYLFRGLEQMQTITVRFVVMRAISTILTFAVVKNDSDLIWIPILDALGTIVAVVLVLKEIKRLGLSIQIGSAEEAWERLKESFVYFASNMATTVFNAFNTLLIGIFLPASDVAYWSVSLQMMGAIQTIYSPIIDGVYPEMVRTKNLRIITRLLTIFMPIIFLGCVFSFFVAEYVLVVVGGAQYAAAKTVFQCLIPVLAFSFPAMLLGWPTIGVIGKQSNVTKTTVFSAVFQGIGMLVLIFTQHLTLIAVAILRCLTELVLLMIRIYYCIRFKERFLTNEHVR